MAGRIFINYRRDDERSTAARIRDRLAGVFGAANVFMDVDNLLAGQRFDKELEKALAETDVFLAVIGPKWMDLFKERQAAGDRDYVREEIAGALKRGIIVIPALIERTPLPRADALPDDIRELVLHQKHEIGHERFGRDIEDLVVAIRTGLKAARAETRPAVAVPWGWVGATAVGALALAYVGAYNAGMPLPWPGSPSPTPDATTNADADARAKAAQEVKARTAAEANARASAAEAERQRLAALKFEDDRQRAAAEAKRKTEEDSARAAAETGKQRLAAIKAEEDRQKAAVEAKRKAAEAEAARLQAREAERQQLAAQLAALKIEEDRQRTAAEPKRKAAEEEGKPTPQPGQTIRDCKEGCPEMVIVPAGSFLMGSDERESEKPRPRVTIRQSFGVGKFEVTFAEWEACVAGSGCASNKRPNDLGWGKGRRPVMDVSWNHANEYVSWLSRKTGKTYRLLSEAEWEYAARAGSTTRYSWGNAIGKGNANCDGCDSQGDDRRTAPVGSFKANAFGLHDMHGNVMEWVEDSWHANYQDAPTDGSAWTGGDPSYRVMRGGSWRNLPVNLSAAIRYLDPPDFRHYYIGFRVARTL